MRMMGADLQATREQQRRAELYGMDMQRVTAANEATAAARQQVMGGIGSLAGAAIGVGMKGGFNKTVPDVTTNPLSQDANANNVPDYLERQGNIYPTTNP
jgi:ABC-type branched-subunit amino acid transport system permease subunit